MQQQPQVIEIFDRCRVRRNRNRSSAAFARHDFLFQWVYHNLADRIGDIRRDFPLVLQTGARGENKLKELLPNSTLITMDNAENFLDGKKYGVQAEEEFLPFKDNTFDAVISPLALHSVNDLPGALVQINRVLKPDGLFLGAMLGGETLYELRRTMMQAEINIKGGASPRVAPFVDKPQTGALLQRAGFALPVVDSEIITTTYDSIFNLMHDIRGMGEGNSLADRRKTPPGKALFMETARLYQEQFSENDGRITASFEIIFMIGWAPHSSQQQPLRPGSAKQRLADALQTEERKSGVKVIE